jgi:hypothetical protein
MNLTSMRHRPFGQSEMYEPTFIFSSFYNQLATMNTLCVAERWTWYHVRIAKDAGYVLSSAEGPMTSCTGIRSAARTLHPQSTCETFEG